MPWEILAAMEKIVVDGKSSFSRSESLTKNVNWLSLIIPNDAKMVQVQLENFESSNFIPESLIGFEQVPNFETDRYQASIDWIEQYGHAVISNGPFYLQGYSPDSRSITIKSFDSSGYPLEQGMWKDFEYADFPSIESVQIKELVQKGMKLDIPITVKDSTEIHYFLSNTQGEIITSGVKSVEDNHVNITIGVDETENIPVGPNTLKVFAASDDVLRPYEFSTSFLVTEPDLSLPETIITENSERTQNDNYLTLTVIIIIIIIALSAFAIRKKMQ